MLVVMKYLQLLFSILLLQVSTLQAQQVVLAINDYWPPFSEVCTDGGGLGVDLLTQAMSRDGTDVYYEETPWTRILVMLENGEDVVVPGIWYTEERSKYLHFSDPFYLSQIKFLKQSGDTYEYSGLDSLAGKTIGITPNYQYGTAFYNSTKFERQPARDLQQNIGWLLKGRIDLTLDTEGVLKAGVRNLPQAQQQQLAIADTPYKEAPIYIACPKASPSCDSVIKRFNAALSEFKHNGIYANLLEKYGLQ